VVDACCIPGDRGSKYIFFEGGIEMAEKESWKSVSRRNFIKGTVAGAGAIAAMGLGPINV
jgi:hypothetical protein